MRVLHVSWEYPPVVYGGLGRHVHALAEAQARRGHDVTVLTQGSDQAPADQVVNGVRIVRVTPRSDLLPLDLDRLLPWVAAFDHDLGHAGLDLVERWRPDVVHGHDWMVAHASTTLRQAADVPLVVTVHATEAGRHQGWLPTAMSRSIHTTEWWLTYEATRVIACSQHMRWEVTRLFAVDADRVDVIPNGIDLDEWRTDAEAETEVRARFAGDGPLVVFTGRLEWEKGPQVLLEAVPALRRRFPGLRVVIAGKGGTAPDLAEQCARLRLGDTVVRTGWLPERDLHALVAAADVAVVPSLYEPFGIVALEAAALGTPLVVSDTGGLGEVVRHGATGLAFPAGDPVALADAVTAALEDPEATARRAAAARRLVEREHDWDLLADRTVQTYRRAAAVGAAPPGRPEDVRPVLPDGNLFSDRTA
ncbi:MAG: glycosyltransferase family 4 protein [Candidatus Nanopelagicales bacterium]